MFTCQLSVNYQAGDWVDRHVLADPVLIADAHDLDNGSPDLLKNFIQQVFQLNALVTAGCQNFNLYGLISTLFIH